MELTQLQKDLLVGTLLGDGNLSRNAVLMRKPRQLFVS